ncbi:MAG TPA: methyltransferase domain-containing protein, partial [Saliniramus sp.]|nr:methyltransferase domain-containing protein [Saliniramus sp.]
DARMPPRARLIARRIVRGPGSASPPRGEGNFGDVRRTSPSDPDFGFSRGLPVDRHFIEAFLEAQSDAIAGRVLEIGDDAYTRRFGGADVTRADVLHVSPDAPGATFTGDLADAPSLPDAAFDCVVLTQTLHLVFDMAAAIGTLARILKPGGVLLLTTPGISQIDRGEWGDTWYWSLTPAAVRRLLGGPEWSDLHVESHGNVLAATAFLQGLAADELTPEELSTCDLAYPVIVTARAVRAGGPA